MTILCPSCRTTLEVPPAASALTYSCPVCQNPFAVAASPPPPPPQTPPQGAPRPPAPATPPRSRPRPAPASSYRWILASLVYVVVLGAVSFPFLQKWRAQTPVADTGSGKTAEEIKKDFDTISGEIVGIIQTENKNIKERTDAEKKKERDEAIKLFEDEIAETERDRRALASRYALLFGGDRQLGDALVDAHLRTWRELIAILKDEKSVAPWIPRDKRSLQLGMVRLWPGMQSEPRLGSWMAKNKIETPRDFSLHVFYSLYGLDEVPNRRLDSLPREVQDLRPTGFGTGFWVSADGYLITNHHVITGRDAVIHVRTADRKIVPAQVVFSDAKRDLALLKATGVQDANWLPLSHGEATQGAHVFTQGFPEPPILGTEEKYEEGKITAIKGMQDEADHYQVSVNLLPGNSGGALIHVPDEKMPWVVGVVCSRITGVNKIGYAIKSTVVRSFLQESDQGRTILQSMNPGLPKDEPIEHARKASCFIVVRSE